MSIAVQYGSTTRGDNDCLSDCDLLIVGKCPKYEENKKYDIVRYTKNRLMRLRKNQSLFLIHLREEGKIIQDDNNWMKGFLKGIPNYIPDEQSLRLSKQNLSIAISLAPNKNLSACWHDMVFVFLRDYLVKLNALNEKYVFSIESLLDFIDIDNKDELGTILRICREIKHNYRNRIQQNIFIKNTWVSSIIKKSLDIRSCQFSFSKIIHNQTKYDPYLVLRLIEYKLIEGAIRLKNYDINKYIKKPSLYSWNIRNTKWIKEIEIVESGSRGF